MTGERLGLDAQDVGSNPGPKMKMGDIKIIIVKM